VTPVHQTAATADTLWTDQDLSSLTSYYYQVVVTDAEGKSAKSNILRATTTAINWISGTVRNAKSSAALPGASLSLAGAALPPVIAANDGGFAIQNPPLGLQTIIAKNTGFLHYADTLAIAATGGVSHDIAILPIPQSVQQLGGMQTSFTDVNDVVTDAVYAYAIDRDYAGKVLAVFNLASPELAPVKISLNDSCPSTPADIAVVNGSVFVTSPQDKRLVRIENPALIASVATLTLPCEPFGVVTDGTLLYIAGKKDFNGTGSLLIVDPASMQITRSIDVPNFGADYDNGQFLFGPRLALANGIAYLSNGAKASGIGKVAKITLASATVDTMITVSLPKLSDLAVRGDRVFLASANAGVDSVLVFNGRLRPLPGIKSGAPALSIDLCANGAYAGELAYAAAATASDARLLFINPRLNTEPAGEMTIGAAVRSVSFTPDGAAMVVTTADKVFKVGL
jgi:hypothetical protein